MKLCISVQGGKGVHWGGGGIPEPTGTRSGAVFQTLELTPPPQTKILRL